MTPDDPRSSPVSSASVPCHRYQERHKSKASYFTCSIGPSDEQIVYQMRLHAPFHALVVGIDEENHIWSPRTCALRFFWDCDGERPNNGILDFAERDLIRLGILNTTFIVVITTAFFFRFVTLRGRVSLAALTVISLSSTAENAHTSTLHGIVLTLLLTLFGARLRGLLCCRGALKSHL